MSPRALSLLAAVVVGCVPPDQEIAPLPDAADTPSEEPQLRDASGVGAPDLETDEPTGPETPIDDDDDDLPDGPDPWEFGPPDVPDGTMAVFGMECGLLTGPVTKAYRKVGPQWEEVRIEGQETTPWPALLPCFSESGKTLDWGTDGALWLEAGGLGHLADPTRTADHWLGEVAPLDRSSDACDNGLASMGMSWPVRFALELQALVPPAK